MRQSYGDKTKLTARIHKHYLEPLQNPQERKGCWVLPREILGSTAWLENLWARKSQIDDVPKLIVWGMKDIAFRENELKVWANAFPEAEVVKLENVGHYVQEEGADRLSQHGNHFLKSTVGDA